MKSIITYTIKVWLFLAFVSRWKQRWKVLIDYRGGLNAKEAICPILKPWVEDFYCRCKKGAKQWMWGGGAIVADDTLTTC